MKFDEFVRNYTNPENVSANKLIKEFRAQGGRVGNDKAKEIIREELNREFDAKKSVRKSKKDKPGRAYGVRVVRLNAKTKKRYYVDADWLYVVEYYLQRGDVTESKPTYSTIAVNRQLQPHEVVDMLFEMFDRLQSRGEVTRDARYEATGISEEKPIKIKYVIDNRNRTKFGLKSKSPL